MEIINLQSILSESEFFKEKSEKDKIILHHTVSSSTAKSVIDWWNKTKDRVSVPYIIEKNGKIYQVFNDEYWSYHIGGNATKNDNKTSIGIEIINEGPLIRKDNAYYWFDGKVKYYGEVYPKKWRNYDYWATYTDEQVKATAELCKFLCEKFNIPKTFIVSFTFDKNYFKQTGIMSHHNLRADKTDISVAWPVDKFIKYLNM